MNIKKLTKIFDKDYLEFVFPHLAEDYGITFEHLKRLAYKKRLEHMGCTLCSMDDNSMFHAICGPEILVRIHDLVIRVPYDFAERALVLGYLPAQI